MGRSQPIDKFDFKLTSAHKQVVPHLRLRKSIQKKLVTDADFTRKELEYLHDQAKMATFSVSASDKRHLLGLCNSIRAVLGEQALPRAIKKVHATGSSIQKRAT